MAKSERSYQSNQTRWWKCKYYFKKFITFLFSHIGLTGCVVGYIILGAIIFRELEIGYERMVKGRVLQNRAKFADMIYMHCRSFSQAQMFAHAMTPCATLPPSTTASSLFDNNNNDDFFFTSSTSSSPYRIVIDNDDTLLLTTTTLLPYANNNDTVNDNMRNSNNYGDGDDRSYTTTTTTTTRRRTTELPTTTTTRRWTFPQENQYTSSTPTPALAIDRYELQSRVGDAIVDLWQSAEMRQLENVVADNTWEINERFNVLYKRNWTREARRELRQLERRLLQRVYTQIMMSIFGAADLRANELSLDLDDSMVTEAPPEAPPPSENEAGDIIFRNTGGGASDARRRTSTTTAKPHNRRQRPTRSVFRLPDDDADALMMFVERRPAKATLTNSIKNGDADFDADLKNEKSKTSFTNLPLPIISRFKRQNEQPTSRPSDLIAAVRNSPTVGPPDSTGRRRLSSSSLFNTANNRTRASPTTRHTHPINSSSVFTANNSNISSSGVVDTYTENDVISAVDADDDDDELLFGGNEEQQDNAPPPSRQPPDVFDNHTMMTDDAVDPYSRVSKHRKYNTVPDDEDDDEQQPRARNATVEKLLDILQNQDWLLTDQQERYFNRSVFDLVIHFEHNVSALILKEGYDGSMDRELWSFSGGLLFSLTVITTIGYGHIAPKTITGRLSCVVYSIIGIPLMLLCLANIGDALAIAFKFIYWKICCLYCHYRKRKRRLKRARSTRSTRKSPLTSALRKQSGKSQNTSGSGSTTGGARIGGDTEAGGGSVYPTVAITGPGTELVALDSSNLYSNNNAKKPSIMSGIVTGDRLLAQSLAPSSSSSSQPATTATTSTPSPSIQNVEVTVRKSSTDAAPTQMPRAMPPGIRSGSALLLGAAAKPNVVESERSVVVVEEEEDVEAAEMQPLNAAPPQSPPPLQNAASGESETEFSTAIVVVNEHDDKSLKPALAGMQPSSSSQLSGADVDWASSERPSSPDVLNEDRRRLLTTKQTTGPLGERRISVTLSAPHNMNRAAVDSSTTAGGIKKAKKVITIDRAVSEPGELASTPGGGGDASSPAITTTTANFESWGSLEGDNFTERYKRVNVPIWACLLVVVLYLFGGGVMFSQWEGWNVFEGAYFCYISLTTIGFGDIVPGFNAVESDRDAQIKMALCAVYLLFGMALLAMSFNLVQENVIETCKNLARRIGILAEDEDENGG